MRRVRGRAARDRAASAAARLFNLTFKQTATRLRLQARGQPGSIFAQQANTRNDGVQSNKSCAWDQTSTQIGPTDVGESADTRKPEFYPKSCLGPWDQTSTMLN